MQISQIQTLDDGMSGISCSGVVTYVKVPVHQIGEKNGQPYDFWTQFIVVKDATGEIGVNLNLGDESYLAAIKGKQIAVEKGKVSSYIVEKGESAGQRRKSLRASLVVSGDPLQGQQGLPQGRQAPKGAPAGQSDQEKVTRLSIERQTSVKAACQLYAGITAVQEDVLEFAKKATYFIATGQIPNIAVDEPQETELGPSIPDRIRMTDLSQPREPGEDENAEYSDKF